jgi:hypothetical protein
MGKGKSRHSSDHNKSKEGANDLKKLTKPFGAFKKDAFGIDRSDSDEIQKHFLRGSWMDGTLKHYNSGVVKLLRFAEVVSPEPCLQDHGLTDTHVNICNTYVNI